MTTQLIAEVLDLLILQRGQGDDHQLIAGLLFQRGQLAGQGLFLFRAQQLGVIDHPPGQGRELDLGGQGGQGRQPKDEAEQQRRDQCRRAPVPHDEGGRGHVERIRPPEPPPAGSNPARRPAWSQARRPPAVRPERRG
ncbi:hypothetical protein D3C80_1426250 [compost metagenome]